MTTQPLKKHTDILTYKSTLDYSSDRTQSPPPSVITRWDVVYDKDTYLVHYIVPSSMPVGGSMYLTLPTTDRREYLATADWSSHVIPFDGFTTRRDREGNVRYFFTVSPVFFYPATKTLKVVDLLYFSSPLGVRYPDLVSDIDFVGRRNHAIMALFIELKKEGAFKNLSGSYKIIADKLLQETPDFKRYMFVLEYEDLVKQHILALSKVHEKVPASTVALAKESLQLMVFYMLESSPSDNIQPVTDDMEQVVLNFLATPIPK